MADHFVHVFLVLKVFVYCKQTLAPQMSKKKDTFEFKNVIQAEGKVDTLIPGFFYQENFPICHSTKTITSTC